MMSAELMMMMMMMMIDVSDSDGSEMIYHQR